MSNAEQNTVRFVKINNMLENSHFAVLCVDDDESILKVLNYQLQKFVNTERVLCEFFINPEEALKTLDLIINENIKVIFIISDYQMPNMNGAQLLEKVKQKYPSIHCIMLSGQANDSEVTRLKKEGTLDYFVSKPWEENLLFEKIREIVSSDKLNPKYINS